MTEGQQAPKKKGCGTYAIVGGVVLFALILLSSMFGDLPKDGAPSATTKAATEKPEPAKELPVFQATQMVKDFEANEISALQKYDVGEFKVTGQVLAIDSDIMDNPMVRMGGANDFIGASASLDEEHKPWAAKLTKGQKVTLICDGVAEAIGIPQLENCAPE